MQGDFNKEKLLVNRFKAWGVARLNISCRKPLENYDIFKILTKKRSGTYWKHPSKSSPSPDASMRKESFIFLSQRALLISENVVKNSKR